ncbi:hypothetical protein EVAR_64263_1 [Eumeta japonica]|uniref:Uncharacterized protein n=1 Tax=Eumeta variegata TaxID=151549 RepID=A0A4C1YSY8_EUMVA|nr:hypothetical protein EVAR_64263_1 [Eumeta japonica]
MRAENESSIKLIPFNPLGGGALAESNYLASAGVLSVIHQPGRARPKKKKRKTKIVRHKKIYAGPSAAGLGDFVRIKPTVKLGKEWQEFVCGAGRLIQIFVLIRIRRRFQQKSVIGDGFFFRFASQLIYAGGGGAGTS